MSDVSLKEKLGARLHVAPPESLSAGALFADERRWSEFLSATAREPRSCRIALTHMVC